MLKFMSIICCSLLFRDLWSIQFQIHCDAWANKTSLGCHLHCEKSPTDQLDTLATMHQRLGYLFASSILRGRWSVQFQKHCNAVTSETLGCPLHDQRSQQVTKDQLHMFAHRVSASGCPLVSSNFSHTAIPGPTRPSVIPYSHTVTSCSDSTNRSPCLCVSGSSVCVLFRGL